MTRRCDSLIVIAFVVTFGSRPSVNQNNQPLVNNRLALLTPTNHFLDARSRVDDATNSNVATYGGAFRHKSVHWHEMSS